MLDTNVRTALHSFFGRPVGGAVEGLEVLSVNGPVHGHCRRLFGLLVPLAFAVAAIPAAPSGAAQEAKRSPAEVAERLKTIQTIAGDVAAAGAHKEKATLIAEGIPPVWASVEDTVKANDKASYEALEAAIESLEEAAKAGDGTKAGGAAGALTSAVNFYVAKFPPADSADRKAASATPTPAPASPSDRTAAGADTPAPAEPRTAAEAPTSGEAAAAEAGDATLARTGPMSAALAAVAGAAFALGGLGVMAGARRRTSPIA